MVIKEVRKRDLEDLDRDPDQTATAVRDPNRRRQGQHRPTSHETADEIGRALLGKEGADPEADQGQDPTVLEAAVAAAGAVVKTEAIGTLTTKVRMMGTACMWQIWTARLENVTWKSCLANTDHSRRSGWPDQCLALLSSFFGTARMRKRPKGRPMVQRYVVGGSESLLLDLAPEDEDAVASILACDAINVESAATFHVTAPTRNGVTSDLPVQEDHGLQGMTEDHVINAEDHC